MAASPPPTKQTQEKQIAVSYRALAAFSLGGLQTSRMSLGKWVLCWEFHPAAKQGQTMGENPFQMKRGNPGEGNQPLHGWVRVDPRWAHEPPPQPGCEGLMREGMAVGAPVPFRSPPYRVPGAVPVPEQ